MDDTTPKPVKLSLRKKLLFMAILGVVMVGFLELAVRIVWTEPPQVLGTELAQLDLFVPHDELGWHIRPESTVDHVLVDGRKVVIKTNKAGYRDLDRTPAPTAGTPRVLVLGDSFTFGYGVENEEIFTSRLQEMIPDAEFVNLGVTGYTLAQELRLLELEGLGYKPDMVLVALCQNDVKSGKITSLAERRKRKKKKAPPETFRAKLRKHSRLYALVTGAIARNKGLSRWLISIGLKSPMPGYSGLSREVRTALKEYPEQLTAYWDETLGYLDRIKGHCDQAGIPLVVAAIPSREAVEPGVLGSSIAYVDFDEEDFDLDKPYRELAKHCEQAGIAYVNPTAAFREVGTGLYLPFDIHWNAPGHKLFAEQVAPRVRQILAKQ